MKPFRHLTISFVNSFLIYRCLVAVLVVYMTAVNASSGYLVVGVSQLSEGAGGMRDLGYGFAPRGRGLIVPPPIGRRGVQRGRGIGRGSRGAGLQQQQAPSTNDPSVAQFRLHLLPQKAELALGIISNSEDGLFLPKEFVENADRRKWLEEALAERQDADDSFLIKPQIVCVPLDTTTIEAYVATRQRLFGDASTFGMKLSEYVKSLTTSAIAQYRGAQSDQTRELRLLRVFSVLSRLSRDLDSRVPNPIKATSWLRNGQLRDRRPAPEQIIQQLANENALSLATKAELALTIAEDVMMQSLGANVGGPQQTRTSVWMAHQSLKVGRKAKGKKSAPTQKFFIFGFDPLAPKHFATTLPPPATKSTAQCAPSAGGANGSPNGRPSKSKENHASRNDPDSSRHTAAIGGARGDMRSPRGGRAAHGAAKSGNATKRSWSAVVKGAAVKGNRSETNEVLEASDEIPYGAAADAVLDLQAQLAEERMVALAAWVSRPAIEYVPEDETIVSREHATHLRTAMRVVKFTHAVLDRVKQCSQLASFLVLGNAITGDKKQLMELSRKLARDTDDISSEHERFAQLAASFGLGAMILPHVLPPSLRLASQIPEVASSLLAFSEELFAVMAQNLFQYSFHVASSNPHMDPVAAAFLARMPMVPVPAVCRSSEYDKIAAPLLSHLEKSRAIHQTVYRILTDHRLPTERPPPESTPTTSDDSARGALASVSRGGRGTGRVGRGRGRGRGRGFSAPPLPALNSIPDMQKAARVIGGKVERQFSALRGTKRQCRPLLPQADGGRATTIATVGEKKSLDFYGLLAKEEETHNEVLALRRAARAAMLVDRAKFWKDLPRLVDGQSVLGHRLAAVVHLHQHFSEKRNLVQEMGAATSLLGKTQKQLRYWSSKAANDTARTVISTTNEDAAQSAPPKQKPNVVAAKPNGTVPPKDNKANVVSKTSDGVSQTADPVSKTSADVSKIRALVSKTSDVVSKTTDVVSKTSDAVSKTSDVVSQMQVEREPSASKAGGSRLFAVPKSGGVLLCRPCHHSLEKPVAKAAELNMGKSGASALNLPSVAVVHGDDLPIWTRSEAAKQMFRPWMRPDLMRSPHRSIRFDDVDVWTRGNFFSADGKGAERLLKEYNETICGMQVDLGGTGRYAVGARDRPPCGVCQGCAKPPETRSCQTSWYPAYLSVHSCQYKGTTEKIIVVFFPGWALRPENQQHEHHLLRKLIANDPVLLNDYNVRVFRWQDLDSLAGQIGRIKPPVVENLSWKAELTAAPSRAVEAVKSANRGTLRGAHRRSRQKKYLQLVNAEPSDQKVAELRVQVNQCRETIQKIQLRINDFFAKSTQDAAEQKIASSIGDAKKSTRACVVCSWCGVPGRQAAQSAIKADGATPCGKKRKANSAKPDKSRKAPRTSTDQPAAKTL